MCSSKQFKAIVRVTNLLCTEFKEQQCLLHGVRRVGGLQDGLALDEENGEVGHLEAKREQQLGLLDEFDDRRVQVHVKASALGVTRQQRHVQATARLRHRLRPTPLKQELVLELYVVESNIVYSTRTGSMLRTVL